MNSDEGKNCHDENVKVNAIRNHQIVFVDVIIPVHDAAPTIEEAVRSAMDQSIPQNLYTELSSVNVGHVDICVCCYDDGSSDGGMEILKRLQKEYNIDQLGLDGERKGKIASLLSDHSPHESSLVKFHHNLPPKSNTITSMSTRLLIGSGAKSRGAGYARNCATKLRFISHTPPHLDKEDDDVLSQTHHEEKNQYFLCMLDSDDFMHTHRVAYQLSFMLKLPPQERYVTLLGCNFNRLPLGSTWHYSQWANGLSDERLVLEKYREVTILQPTWFISKRRFEDLGRYIEGEAEGGVKHEGKNHDLEPSSAKPSDILPESHSTKTYKHRMIHPLHDTSHTLRLAEDLRFFHEHLSPNKLQSNSDIPPGKLRLLRITNDHKDENAVLPLVTYRHRLGMSQSSSTPRKLLLQLRVLAFESEVLQKNPLWSLNPSLSQTFTTPLFASQSSKGGFVIWGAGRDGKEFFKSLSPNAQKAVRCFAEVDDKKIRAGYYVFNHQKLDKPFRIPIVHFSYLARDHSKRNDLAAKYMASTEIKEGKIRKGSNQNVVNNGKMSNNKKRKVLPCTSSIPSKVLQNLKKHDLVLLDEMQTLPVVVCVAMYRTGGILEQNVKNIGRTEGADLWHFS